MAADFKNKMCRQTLHYFLILAKSLSCFFFFFNLKSMFCPDNWCSAMLAWPLEHFWCNLVELVVWVLSNLGTCSFTYFICCSSQGTTSFVFLSKSLTATKIRVPLTFFSWLLVTESRLIHSFDYSWKFAEIMHLENLYWRAPSNLNLDSTNKNLQTHSMKWTLSFWKGFAKCSTFDQNAFKFSNKIKVWIRVCNMISYNAKKKKSIKLSYFNLN